MNHQLYKTLPLCFCLFFICLNSFILVYFQIYQAHIWIDGIPFIYPSQTISTTPFTHLIYWIPRFFILTPVFITADVFGLSLNTSFSYFCQLNVVLLSLVIFFSVQILNKRIRKFESKFKIILLYQIYFSFLILSFFMNGRLLFSFLGYMIALYLAVYNFKLPRNNVFLCLAIILSSVSSGGLIVVSLFIIFSLQNRAVLDSLRLNKHTLLLYSLLGLLLCVFAIYKNVLFFYIDGNKDVISAATKFLEHGWGGLFFRTNLYNNQLYGILLAAIIIFLVIYAFLISFIHSKENLDRLILCSLYIPFIVGAVGWGSFSLILPPLATYASIFFERLLDVSHC